MLLFNYHSILISVPSKAPSELILSAVSSTSITASWQLPPAYSRHGIIAGFKLFYKKKGFIGSIRVETINYGRTFLGVINGLDKYTEYEFQVLAFMVMDQRVQLWWREQWKMVRNLIVCNSCNSTFGWFSRAYHCKVGLTWMKVQ